MVLSMFAERRVLGGVVDVSLVDRADGDFMLGSTAENASAILTNEGVIALVVLSTSAEHRVLGGVVDAALVYGDFMLGSTAENTSVSPANEGVVALVDFGCFSLSAKCRVLEGAVNAALIDGVVPGWSIPIGGARYVQRGTMNSNETKVTYDSQKSKFNKTGRGPQKVTRECNPVRLESFHNEQLGHNMIHVAKAPTD